MKWDIESCQVYYFAADLAKANEWWGQPLQNVVDELHKNHSKARQQDIEKPYVKRLTRIFPKSENVLNVISSSKIDLSKSLAIQLNNPLQRVSGDKGPSFIAGFFHKKQFNHLFDMIELYQKLVMLTRDGPLPPYLEGVAYFKKEDRKPVLADHAMVISRQLGREGLRYFVYSEDPPAYDVKECIPPGFEKVSELVAYSRSIHAKNGLLQLDVQAWLKHMGDLVSNEQVWNLVMADRFLGPHLSGLYELLKFGKERNLDVIAGRRSDLEVDIDDFDEID
jgi:hypothetical protein